MGQVTAEVIHGLISAQTPWNPCVPVEPSLSLSRAQGIPSDATLVL